MEAAEFDQFADEYDRQHRANIAITGEGPEYFSEYKIRELRAIAGAGVQSILDFGSGTGNSIPYFQKYFAGARITGVDPSQRSLEIAAARFPEAGPGLVMSGDQIPAPDNAFDLAFSACVFHHIDHAEHVKWLTELRRVVRPGGALTIFEHNPLNPLTVRAVNTCPFDVNARLISARRFAQSYRAAGWTKLKVRYHVFFPRALAALRGAEPGLAWLPLGGQYSITAVK